MDWLDFHKFTLFIQHSISFTGSLIIFSGVIYALYQYCIYIFKSRFTTSGPTINSIRLMLGRIIILGLEFIVAADLIGTTTTPDYYSVGMVAIIVLIRTILSYTLNREIASLGQESTTN